MKNNLMKFLTIFMAVAFVTMQSCEKGELIQTKAVNNNYQEGQKELSSNNTFTDFSEYQIENSNIDFNYSIDNNILIFESIKDYETAIRYTLNKKTFIWEKDSEFISMHIHYKTKNQENKIPVKDPVFSRMINPEGVIGIAEHFFRIDIENENVYAILRSENCKDIEKTLTKLNENSNNSNVMVYSTEDDVLNELYNLYEDNKKGSYCSNRTIGPFSLPYGIGGERIYWKNVYFKAGIYNSLYAKMWATSVYNIKITIKPGSFWKNKKESDYSISGTWTPGGENYV